MRPLESGAVQERPIIFSGGTGAVGCMKPLQLEGLVTQGTREAWAVTSPCGLYRYALGRAWDPAPEGEWDPVRPVFDVFGLNPSKARHDTDDPTMRKLVHYAKQEGCGSLLLRNVFAYHVSRWRCRDCCVRGETVAVGR